MTLWKLAETHQVLLGKVTWKSWRTIQTISPLMISFVRDGSIYFALYVNLFLPVNRLCLLAATKHSNG